LKFKRFLPIIISLCILFSSCIQINAVNIENYNHDVATLNETNFLHLTKEQLLEDYEYYWKIIKENSPLFAASERINKISGKYEEYKHELLNSNSNLEQLECIVKLSQCLIGHTGLFFDPKYGQQLYNTADRQIWYKHLIDPISEKNYNLYKLFRNKKLGYIVKSQKDVNEIYANCDNNIETKIIKYNEIAYVKIKSFGSEYIEEDKPKLFDFYNKIGGYKNLIIDITGNSGGSTTYLYKNLLPLLTGKLSVKQYMLFKVGNKNREFIEEAFGNDNLKPICGLPNFENLSEHDKKGMTHFFCAEFTQELEKQINFSGKIWILIDGKVFSTSEALSINCKQTGCATLVGTNTSGDGIGCDPALMVLPNSKLVFRYSLEYGLNSDGSSNAIFGTKPDIVSSENETPLETCLKTIYKSVWS